MSDNRYELRDHSVYRMVDSQYIGDIFADEDADIVTELNAQAQRIAELEAENKQLRAKLHDWMIQS